MASCTICLLRFYENNYYDHCCIETLMRTIKIQGIHLKLHKSKHYIVALKVFPVFYWDLKQNY
jgi:hypothetical protein